MDGSCFERRFDTYAEYLAAMRQVVEGSRTELCVFDPDLTRTGLEAVEAEKLLTRFLRSHRHARLRVVLHDTDPLERDCPRLMRLLAHFSHRIEVRRSPDDLRNLSECYALTDANTGVLRFHRDWPRGKWFVGNPDEAGVLRSRFGQLWECSEPAVCATRLGL